MFLLFGGDSELGAATFRDLRQQGRPALATTRRRDLVSAERPFFDILHSLDAWALPPDVDAACIFLANARLRDCAANPAATERVNVTQALRLIDQLLASDIYVLYLSSNQVFDGEQAHVSAHAPASPVSEYGRQKAETEAAIRDRIQRGAPAAIMRLSKVLSSRSSLIKDWTKSLRQGEPIYAFGDMMLAPVPICIVTAAISALLQNKLPGIWQLSGPRDVAYSEIGHHLAKDLGADANLVKVVSAYATAMPDGSTPRNTTLDSRGLAETFGIVVPDVWDVLDLLSNPQK